MADEFKYQDLPWVKDDAKEIVFSLISLKSKVLDLGCWTGLLGDKLAREKQCNVVGVDVNPKAINIAETRLDEALLVDLDDAKELENLSRSLHNDIGCFDFITATDVLEHLKRPQKVMAVAKTLMTNSSRLIISVPNIAFWAIRLKLLFGQFDYENTGILDDTHLRFFTKSSAERFLIENGFDIEQFFYTGTKIFPTLKAFQFVFVCKKE